MTPQKLHSILKRAGLKKAVYYPSKMVQGYGTWTDGYRLTERKTANPDWMGFGMRKRLPKFLPTGVFEITGELDRIEQVLTQAGVKVGREDGKIVVQEATG